MSNLAIVLIPILISLISCAIFMSAYKEEQKDDNAYIRTIVTSYRELIAKHTETLDILRARVYDLENKVNEITNEMEKLDDGK